MNFKQLFIALCLVAFSGLQAQTWQWLGPDSVEVDHVYAKGETIYVGTLESLYRTVDGGRTWIVVDSSLGKGQIVSLGVDPKNPRTLFVAKGAGIHYTGGLLYRSVDAGTTWQLLSDTAAHKLEAVRYVGVSPHNSRVVFATDRSGFAGEFNDLYRSADGGQTWSFVGGDFAFSSHGVKIEIAFDPADSLRMYATGDNSFDVQFYVSTDGGVRWRSISYLQGTYIDIFVDRLKRSTIYVFPATARSDDAGYTWRNIGATLPPSSRVRAAAINMKDPEVLCVAMITGVATPLGVFKTTDGGNLWQKLEGSESLPINGNYVRSLVIDTLSHTVYIGTLRGVYGYNLVTSVKEGEELPSTFRLYQNYPNPFNPETRITYDVGKPAFVTVEVADLLGRRIRTLVSTEHARGRYTLIWDGRDDGGDPIATGVYFYRLQAPGFLITRKMLYVK